MSLPVIVNPLAEADLRSGYGWCEQQLAEPGNLDRNALRTVSQLPRRDPAIRWIINPGRSKTVCNGSQPGPGLNHL